MSSTLLALAAVVAQHCGGPCEVPRGADPVSADPKYALTAGKERADWRYLWNWVWTEDGVEKHHLEQVFRAPPLCGFGYRRVFVSPAGNGFLVTGNPYAGKYQTCREAPLFVFCDPEGHRLVEIPLERGLTGQERRLGKCPACKCCVDVLYVFEEDPALSDNGCFVELTACGTRRRLGFFLPLGLPVRDRTAFEAVLAEAEWGTVAPSQRAERRQQIEAAVGELGAADPGLRARASDALVAEGWLALEAVRKAHKRSESAEVRGRAAAIEKQLRPWRSAGWQAMAIDLGLLGALLRYPDEDVTRAVCARLDRILPPSKGMDAAARAAWLDGHRAELKWDVASGCYVRS